MIGRFTALAVLGIAVSSQAWGYVHKESVEKLIPGEGKSRLVVSNPTGVIKVRRAEGEGVSLRARKVVRAEDRSEAVQTARKIKVKVTENDEEIRIKVKLPRRREGGSVLGDLLGFSARRRAYVELSLEIPAGLRLVINTTSGDVDVEGVGAGGRIDATSGEVELFDCAGDFAVAVTSGTVSVEGLEGDLRLSSASGDMSIRDVKGSVRVSTASGDFVGSEIAGAFELDGASGDVVLKGSGAAVRVSTASGDVRLAGVEGRIAVNTSSGDVTIRMEAGGAPDVDVSCSSGDIRFFSGQKSSYRLEIVTVSGTVYADVPIVIDKVNRNGLRGSVRSGKGKVRLSTSSGDVRVREG